MVKYKRGHLYYPVIPLHKVLENTAESFPDKLAFLYPKEITYKKFREQVDVFATVLKNLGVKKGDRVALYAHNSIEWEIAFYGLEKAGATLVPMNPLFKETEVKYEANDSGAETIIILKLSYLLSQKMMKRILKCRRVHLVGQNLCKPQNLILQNTCSILKKTLRL